MENHLIVTWQNTINREKKIFFVVYKWNLQQ